MYRFAFRPKWLLFHLLVLVLVVVMVNLGMWQLHRLQGRRAFNHEVRTRASQPVAEFDQVVTSQITTLDDAKQVEWRPVHVEGTYLADEQVVIINRSQGGVAGENVVTPLLMADGEVVLINRGFISETAAVPAPPSGPVEVTGRLRRSEKRSFGGLTDPPGDLTELQRLDLGRLAEQLPGPLAPVFVDLRTSTPALTATDPAPVPDPELDEGPHKSYMVQWFIFSICAIVGWVLALRRSAQRRLIAAAAAQTPADSPQPVVDESTTAPH